VADVKISALPSGTAARTDELPANQTGTTRRITVASVLGQIGSSDIPAVLEARITRSTHQSIVTATTTVITFDTVTEDVGGFWAAGQPTRLTIPTSGVYVVTTHITFDQHATGFRYVAFRLNGGSATVGHQKTQAHAVDGLGYPNLSTGTVRRFTAGDYLEIEVFQNSGGNLDCLSSSGNPLLSIARIGS
jgi:hypothetical protein